MDRWTRVAERALRVAGDARLGLGLLLATGMVNGLAALLPDGPALLDAWPYAVLLGLVATSGVAAVAVRSPTIWREWRTPTAVQAGAGTVRLEIGAREPDEIQRILRGVGYRTRVERTQRRWAVHGIRRG
ncbi:MAG: hypothetical protein ABIO99_01870, partial [Candidatus Limnocylindria bacterium]